MLEVLIIATMVLGLRLLGRRWWCSCGSMRPWSFAVTSACNSGHVCDPYSPTHLSHGIALCLILSQLVPAGWLFLVVLAAECFWELIENTNWAIRRYRKQTMSTNYEGDSVANSLGDVGCCMLGAWWAQVVGYPMALAAVVVLEVVLAVEIRDNLLINIVMLIHPFEAIKKWQDGTS